MSDVEIIRERDVPFEAFVYPVFSWDGNERHPGQLECIFSTAASAEEYIREQLDLSSCACDYYYKRYEVI